MLFGLVANRALAPSSKLAAADWITHDVHTDGLPETSDDVCYRAMGWLHDVREHLEREVFHQVADLLNLEVDLLGGWPSFREGGRDVAAAGVVAARGERRRRAYTPDEVRAWL